MESYERGQPATDIEQDSGAPGSVETIDGDRAGSGGLAGVEAAGSVESAAIDVEADLGSPGEGRPG